MIWLKEDQRIKCMSRPLQLLVIEDSPEDTEQILNELQRAGFAVTCQRVDTASALATALDQDSWDLIISEYRPPHFDGYTALQRYQDKGLDLPFIIISDKMDDQDAFEAMKAGVHHIIPRGNLVRLVPAVEHELKESQLRKEHRAAQDALRQSEERFRQLSQASFEGIAITHQGKFIDVNDQFVRMLGYQRSEIIGKSVLDLVAPEYHQLVITHLKTGYEQPYELLAVKNDGTIIPVEVHGKSISYSGLAARVTAIRDITRRKQNEKILRYYQSLERLVTSISTRFISIHTDQIDAEIQHALQQIGEFTGVDRSYLWLVSEDQTIAKRTHEWCLPGLDSVETELRDLSPDKFPWMAQNVLSGQATIISNVADMPEEARAERDLFLSWGVKSLFNVPLIAQEKLIGILGFQCYFQEKNWSPETITILRIVGHIFANAIERKRVEQEIQNHLHRLEAIRKIELSILAAQSPRETALTALENISLLLPYFLGGVALYDFDADQVEFLAIYTTRTEVDSLLQRHYTIDDFTPYIDTLKAGDIYVIPDLAEVADLNLSSMLLKEVGIRSFIDIPLIVRGELIGSFSVLSDQPNAFEQHHIDFAREVGDALAVSIQQGRLLESEQRRRQELESLEQVSMSLRQADTHSELFSILLTETRELAGADTGVILTPQDHQFAYTLIQGDEIMESILTQQKFAQLQLVEVISAKDSAFFTDLPFDMRRVVSAAVLPIYSIQQIFGAIELLWYERHEFPVEERHMLKTIADMAGIALERMHILTNLEHQVTERTYEITTLYELTALLAAGGDLTNTLQQTLERLLGTINSTSGAIHIMDNKHDHLQLIAHQGLDAQTKAALKIVSPDHILWKQLGEIGEPLLLINIDEQILLEADLNSITVKNYVGAPIRSSDQTFGMISVFYTSEHDPSLDEISLLNLVADQVGIAVERNRLRQQAEQAAIMTERQRLARELHDAVTQSLYSLSFLAKASRNFARNHQWEQVEQHLETLQDTAQQALKEMRLLIYELLPTSIEQQGLVSVLRHRLESVEQRAGIDVEFRTSGTVELPLNVQFDIYRIAQEALNNILKHANASQVSVELLATQHGLEMTITDNGTGFDQAQAYGGIGLDSMRERAEKLRAELFIKSFPGKGTHLKLILAEVRP
jgi:PAS domain S-box-containing protein